MTGTGHDQQQWRGVDEGWGRRAVDFATLSEPANAREYVALHQHLGVGGGDSVLDVACGAGLALELAAARGATCAGIDASERLVAVARDRVPGADVRVGDMHAMPWDDGTFDVVTSFRGIWGTTPEALAEVRRVLRPGGRLGLTVWGHIKASPGAWALQPFTLASRPKVANQAAMVALGRPGAGEQLLARWGFEGVSRIEIPFVWEFADPEHYARALASTGPAYEAIQSVGEDAFVAYALGLARERVRDGLPLRAPILVVGYVARAARRRDAGAPGSSPSRRTRPEAQALYDDDLEDLGYVMNATRIWAHHPAPGRRALRADGAAGRGRADVPRARHPGHRVRLRAGRRLLLARLGRQARQGGRRRGGDQRAARRRLRPRPRRAGPGRLGPPGRPGPQRHHRRRTCRCCGTPASTTRGSSR